MDSKKVISAVIAVCIGGALGTYVGLAITGGFQLVAPLLGGFVAYLGYDYKTVGQALIFAWNKIIKNPLQLKEKTKPAIEVLKGTLVIGLAVGIIPIGWILLIQAVSKAVWDFAIIDEYMFRLSVTLIWLMICAFNYLLLNDYADSGEHRQVFFFPTAPLFLRILLGIFSPFTLVYLIAKFLIKVVLPFIATVFKIIHSDMRLMVGIDAALGGGIGLLCGSWVIGGITAGCLFLFNLLVVARRWLKVKPV